jgi:hypothetical protein
MLHRINNAALLSEWPVDDRAVTGEREQVDHPGSFDPGGVTGPSGGLLATLQPSINAALWQNHVHVLTELTLKAGDQGILGYVTIDLACEPAVIAPRSWRLQVVGAGQVRPLGSVPV